MLNYSFVRFLLVGILNTICGLSIIFLLYNLLHFNYWLSTFVGNSLGAVISYVLNKTFTFHSKQYHGKTIWKFIIVIFVCYIISYSVSYMATQMLNSFFVSAPKDLFNNIAILLGAGFYTICNYFGQKIWVFKS